MTKIKVDLQNDLSEKPLRNSDDGTLKKITLFDPDDNRDQTM